MIYKKIHTTSTKCQYQVAASNPKWWVYEKWNFICRIKQTPKKMVPIITWIPWNPVDIKNADPYTESLMQNLASLYSYAWRIVNKIPKITVIINPYFVWLCILFIMLWWAHVTDKPEDNKIIVFNNGISIGLNVLIPFGGQVIPISIVGANLLWKNPQKNEMKKNTSDVINRIIPNFNPFTTFDVCLPWYVPSRTISRHHWYIVNKLIIIPNVIKYVSFLCIHKTIPDVVVIAPIDPVKGQGLLSTRW